MLERLLGPGTAARIATALERLVALYELDLASRGLTVLGTEGEGEIIDPDENYYQKLDDDEERKKEYGLAPGTYPHPVAPDGYEWPGKPGNFPVGPEGAEVPPSPLAEERRV